jgi:trk system potassium uptake protein
MMRRLLDLPLLVILLGLAGLAMFLPAAHAVILRDHGVGRAFFYTGFLVIVFAAMLALAQGRAGPANVARNQLVSMALAYVMLPPVLALPLIQAAAGGASLGSATFEMLSAFTMTGAVILEGVLAPSVQLWRSLVGWLGGLFTLVMVFSILVPLNLGGVEVENGRIPGRAAAATQQITRIADPSERMQRYAAGIFPLYTGMTLVLWIGLTMTGQDSFLALCHAMGTLSTSGISPFGAGFDATRGGWLAEALIAVCLIFALTRRPWLRYLGQRRQMDLQHDPEVRLGFGILALFVGLLFLTGLYHAPHERGSLDLVAALQGLWALSFTLLSFVTTTGYTSVHWETFLQWSGQPAPDLVLWSLALIGGGVATTAGGVKLLRVASLLRFGQEELDLVIHPNAVARSRAAENTSREATQQGTALAWVFFLIFSVTIGVTTGLLTLGLVPFEEALVLAMAALSNTGPLVDHSGGIPTGFAGQSTWAQAVLGVAMVVGRLETLAILAILLPESFRR